MVMTNMKRKPKLREKSKIVMMVKNTFLTEPMRKDISNQKIELMKIIQKSFMLIANHIHTDLTPMLTKT